MPYKTPKSRMLLPSRGNPWKLAATRASETVAQPLAVSSGQRVPAILQRAKLDFGSCAPAEILTLQRTIGNQAVARLMAGAGGPHASTGAELSRQEPVTEVLQRAASETARPIDEPVRSSLEERFGQDFSHVRVHSGPASASAAERIGARAYTLGSDIHLGDEARGLAPDEYHRLLAHEAVHTVQQGGQTVAPHAGLTVSSPADAAEHEAERIATSVTSADTITRSVPAHLQRDLSGKKTVKDGDFDLDLKTEAHPQDADHPNAQSGMSGTIKFTPSAGAPDSTNIRILQTVRNENLSTGNDYEWTGDEANRNKMRTAANAAQGVDKGWFVDHSAAMATPRSSKTDAAVSPYYRDYWSNASVSQDGSKSGTTVNLASIWDFPQSAGNRRFSFETAAKAADTGYIYATLTWGFTISDASKGKVENEHASANRGPSATFNAAVKAFDEFYKNPGASTAPK